MQTSACYLDDKISTIFVALAVSKLWALPHPRNRLCNVYDLYGFNFSARPFQRQLNHIPSPGRCSPHVWNSPAMCVFYTGLNLSRQDLKHVPSPSNSKVINFPHLWHRPCNVYDLYGFGLVTLKPFQRDVNHVPSSSSSQVESCWWTARFYKSSHVLLTPKMYLYFFAYYYYSFHFHNRTNV